MLGGFLGAGKTTTVLRVAQFFQNRGKRVGIITNDQAAGLVDTALLEELNLPVREIAGGCFCCKSENLVDALVKLTADSQPEIFIAEPVGSCTDLVATVSLPLERIYNQQYSMAPYVVIVDPFRAMQSLGTEGAPVFSPDVNYIYRKQLEEAEIIVINKVDVLIPERLTVLRRALQKEYPEAKIIELASRPGFGMEPLFVALEEGSSQINRVMDVDYTQYGIGEALLGWVNFKGILELEGPAAGKQKAIFEPNNWLKELTVYIQKALVKKKIEIAHLKLSLSNGQSIGAVQLVRSAGQAESTRQMHGDFTVGELLVNLRAEGDPDRLASSVCKAIASTAEKVSGLKLNGVRLEHFRPGQPKPTHRVSTV